MPTSSAAVLPQTIRSTGYKFSTGDSTGTVAVFTAGSNGSVITGFSAVNKESSGTYNLTLTFATFQVGLIPLPVTSGNAIAVPAVDILRSAQLGFLPYDALGNRTFYLAAGLTIQAALSAAVTVSGNVQLFIQGADF